MCTIHIETVSLEAHFVPGWYRCVAVLTPFFWHTGDWTRSFWGTFLHSHVVLFDVVTHPLSCSLPCLYLGTTCLIHVYGWGVGRKLNSTKWLCFPHPPTPNDLLILSKLSILTEFDLFGLKFHFPSIFWGPIFSGQRHTPSVFGPSTPGILCHCKSSLWCWWHAAYLDTILDMGI